MLQASNADRVAIDNVTLKLDQLLSGKNDQISDLKYEIARVGKARLLFHFASCLKAVGCLCSECRRMMIWCEFSRPNSRASEFRRRKLPPSSPFLDKRQLSQLILSHSLSFVLHFHSSPCTSLFSFDSPWPFRSLRSPVFALHMRLQHVESRKPRILVTLLFCSLSALSLCKRNHCCIASDCVTAASLHRSRDRL